RRSSDLAASTPTPPGRPAAARPARSTASTPPRPFRLRKRAMSTDPAPVAEPQASALVPTERLAARPTRTSRVVRWLGFHFGELGLTVGFAVLAVLVSPWFVLGAGGVALLWTVHEVRVRRSPRGGDAS